MRVVEAMAVLPWKDVSGLFTARVMNDCSIAGHDTYLCDKGGSDALPVLCVCFTCSLVLRPSGKEKCTYSKASNSGEVV